MDLLHTKTVSITDCPIAAIRLLQRTIEEMNIVRNASEAQAVRWGATQWALQIEGKNDTLESVADATGDAVLANPVERDVDQRDADAGKDDGL